jgi:hypothetical protein
MKRVMDKALTKVDRIVKRNKIPAHLGINDPKKIIFVYLTRHVSEKTLEKLPPRVGSYTIEPKYVGGVFPA